MYIPVILGVAGVALSIVAIFYSCITYKRRMQIIAELRELINAYQLYVEQSAQQQKQQEKEQLWQ